jgi:hypothetical protein
VIRVLSEARFLAWAPGFGAPRLSRLSEQSSRRLTPSAWAAELPPKSGEAADGVVCKTLTSKRLTNYTATGGNEKVAHALAIEP